MTAQLLPPSSSSAPAFRLSPEDVERLLSEPAAGSRLEVLDKIANAYNTVHFDKKELAIAEQIFRLLVKDTEDTVRESLAQKIKENPNIPQDIIRDLSLDIDSVALPILQFSEVLTEADLLDIIHNSSAISRKLAIAQRKRIPSPLAYALIETQDEGVVSHLMRNPGASISNGGYEKIMQDFAANQNVLSSVSERTDLPLTVVEKLITLVSGAIATQLEQKYKISSKQLMFETEQTRELTTLKMLDRAVRDDDMEKLINQLVAFSRLTSSIILAALCRGNYRFFEMSLAKLARLPSSNVRTLLSDRGSLGFKALYDKAELPESLFDATKLVMNVVRDMEDDGDNANSLNYANRLAEKILYYAEGKDVGNLSYILALVRQNITQH